MNKPPRVSVLVPIYNVAEFLPQCLQSLSNQIMDDMEIICINDGSTDNSLDIIKDFQKKDHRIKILDKKNTGYGDSMNRALKKASGEYIGIVESDDYVDPNMFIDLFSLAKKFDADIAKSNYFEFRNGQDIVREIILQEEAGQVFNPIDKTKIFYQSPSIWSAIYRRDFLEKNKINFLPTPGASYQDASFNFKTLAMAEKIVLTDKPYLHYRRDNMGSSVKSSGKTFVINDEYAEVEKYLKKHRRWDTYAKVFQAVKFAGYHWNMLRLPRRDLKPFLLRMRAEFFDAKQRGLLKKAYFPNLHWKVLNIILKRPPWVFLFLFALYSKDMKRGL